MDTKQQIKEKLGNDKVLPCYKKHKKKWGIKGSSLLDKDTEEEAYICYYNYLNDRGLL